MLLEGRLYWVRPASQALTVHSDTVIFVIVHHVLQLKNYYFNYYYYFKFCIIMLLCILYCNSPYFLHYQKFMISGSSNHGPCTHP